MDNDYRQVTPVLLKPMDLASQLGVSRAWLYKAASLGRIPSIRIGGDDGPLRFVPEDIQRWIDEARSESVVDLAAPQIRGSGGRPRRAGTRHAPRR